ncbi:hypothetical protein [Escherichia phage UPEC03]|nr:hypothetical protein [Escherichia phage UPEC03]
MQKIVVVTQTIHGEATKTLIKQKFILAEKHTGKFLISIFIKL